MMRLNHVVRGMFSAAALCGWAATNEVAELPSVVVTASPVTQEERVSADGVETVVVSRRQLDVLNAGDIQTALRQVPGVTVSRYAPVGSYGGAQGGSGVGGGDFAVRLRQDRQDPVGLLVAGLPQDETLGGVKHVM